MAVTGLPRDEKTRVNLNAPLCDSKTFRYRGAFKKSNSAKLRDFIAVISLCESFRDRRAERRRNNNATRFNNNNLFF